MAALASASEGNQSNEMGDLSFRKIENLVVKHETAFMCTEQIKKFVEKPGEALSSKELIRDETCKLPVLTTCPYVSMRYDRVQPCLGSSNNLKAHYRS